MRKTRLAFLAFASYFIVGVICMMIGSEMSGLILLYEKPIEKVVLIGSAFALGRVVPLPVIDKLVRKYGPLKIMFYGTIGILCYMVGLSIIPIYEAGFLLAFIGGIGMAVADACSPLLLSKAFPKSYSSSLSAGQAIYALGGFAISMMAGYMFNNGLPMYLCNILLSLVGVVSLFIIPKTRWEETAEEAQEEKVRPLYAKNTVLCFVLLGISSLVYCAICSTLGSYMTSWMEASGMSSSGASYVLSIFNLFSLFGSICFIFILRVMKEKTVLLVNCSISIFALLITVLTEDTSVYYITMAVVGFFIGVLFSILIALATRIGYEHISLSGAIIATAGGCGDILAPIVSSFLVKNNGVLIVFRYVIIMLVIMSVIALVISRMTREEEYANSK
ncbi:MAG: MFS transporter [Erysipelotrichaceae bacterium]|nr:MFS transporter [Erysipelotrichaceae bacterium]